MTAPTPRVFSGVQPTGNLHLGNYLGAIVRFVELQHSYECLYCVVDLHAITQPTSVWGGPSELSRNTREVTAAFLAAGIDADAHIVFNQSQVPQHAELAWIFNCVARMGWLGRMTQFKEKAGKDREAASVGLFAYPEPDGRRHPRLPRHPRAGGRGPEAASRAHPRHRAEVQQRLRRPIAAAGYPTGSFPWSSRSSPGPATRVMSLRDGTKKMSKSEPSDLSRINLTDDADTISKKIRKAKTDPDALPSEPRGSKVGRKPTTSSASMPR
jgi:tryptophanyl-tRNA synthetase